MFEDILMEEFLRKSNIGFELLIETLASISATQMLLVEKGILDQAELEALAKKEVETAKQAFRDGFKKAVINGIKESGGDDMNERLAMVKDLIIKAVEKVT